MGPEDIAATQVFDDPGGGVANVEASQGFRNGGIPRILGYPVFSEEIESVDKSNLKFGTVENLEHGEDDGMFEEHEAEKVVQNCDCCEDEDTLSPQDTAETMGDALQFQNHGDASIPSDAGNILKRIVDFKSVADYIICLLYTSPSPRDRTRSRMPSSA